MSMFHSLVISDVNRVTQDSVAVKFAVPETLKQDFAYQPGQYVTIRWMLGDTELRRSYSICSGINENELAIAIKKVDGGQFSTFANENLKVGARIDVMPPQGRFTAPDNAKRLVFFAAGSGITPILSMIKSALSASPDVSVTLFYGNRSTASIMFREALEDLKDSYTQRLSIFHILSRESQDIEILNGRLDAAKIKTLVETTVPPRDVDAYFLCGPYEMAVEGRDVLLKAGATAEQVKVELFSTDGAPQKPVRVAAHHDARNISHVECVLDGVTHLIDVSADKHVIDAAHDQGVELPYSCKGGMCCTCRCKLVSGEVVMDINYSLEPWEIEAGYVLACQSRPLTPKVRLDFDQP